MTSLLPVASRAFVATGVSLLLFSAAPAAETAEPVGETVVDTSEVQEPAAAPVLEPDGVRLSPGPLVPRNIRMDPLHHRGGVYVDAGEGRLALPNAVEQAKLDRARELVEASRAAGTLWVLPPTEDVAELTPEDVSGMKLENLRNQEPQAVDHPLAGVGEMTEIFVPVPTPENAPGDRPRPQPEADVVESETPPTEGVPHE